MSTDKRVKSDLILSGILAIVCVVYLTQAIALPQNSPNQADVGPRTYPLLLGALLVLSTLLVAVPALTRLLRHSDGTDSAAQHQDQPADAAPKTLKRRYLVSMIAVAVITAIYLQVLTPLGFLLATAIYLAILAPIVGGRVRPGRHWITSAVFGCLTSVAIYLLFDTLLGVILPPGLVAF